MRFDRDDGHWVSDDNSLLDLDYVCSWLAEQSYWAQGRPAEVQRRAIEGSLNFGVFHPDGRQVGYCRYVTDRATFAWLCDVFVDEAHRGAGLATWMIACSQQHPDLAGLKRQVLVTSSAAALYRRFGFEVLDAEEAPKWMLRRGQ
jgi:GNAT superfamily N-acetyltransferase